MNIISIWVYYSYQNKFVYFPTPIIFYKKISVRWEGGFVYFLDDLYAYVLYYNINTHSARTYILTLF